ncbi:MAG: tetratricopeptide repeat protein [Gemmatimonadota bacterium]
MSTSNSSGTERGLRPDGRVLSALDHLHAGRQHDRAARLDQAAASYEAALDANTGDPAIDAEALRHLAIVRVLQSRPVEAEALCRRSINLSRPLGDTSLVALGLNALGGICLERGELDQAKVAFEEAGALDVSDKDLAARIEQNLGIIANVRGQWTVARTHYTKSLAAFEQTGDAHGAAVAHHNLGMISADRDEWDTAHHHYTEARRLAHQSGDVRLYGLCNLNSAEVSLARQLYAQAREEAESAFTTFHHAGATIDEADACRVLGVVCRETGRLALAETYLMSALSLTVPTGSAVSRAEVCRDLGLVCLETGREQEALKWLAEAEQLFIAAGLVHEVVGLQPKLIALRVA